MLVTIVADASFCPKTHIAAWASTTSSDRGKRGYCGILKKCNDSGDAESMAICNGIYHAAKYGLIHNGDRLLIYTDCQSAIQLFQGDRQPSVLSRKFDKQTLRWVTSFLSDHNIVAMFRHTKGHEPNINHPRDYNQNWCDARSRQLMRSARNKDIRWRNKI